MDMGIEHDDLDKEWDSRSHTPDEYRREIRELRDRCAKYAQERTVLDAELAELRAQEERGALDFYRPWRSIYGYPPPVDTPVMVAISTLGRDDFVFAAEVMYRDASGKYRNRQDQPLSGAYRVEYWLSLNGLEELLPHSEEERS